MDKWFAPDTLATVRLCDDCFSTRATTEGEHFIPFCAPSASASSIYPTEGRLSN
jgi:hypothetical protein